MAKIDKISSDKPNKAGIVVDITQSSIFGIIYALFLKSTWIEFLEIGLGRFIFGPVTIALAGIGTVLALYDLNSAKNKNLSKFSQLAIKLVSFILVVLFTTVASLAGILSSALLTFIAPIILSVLMGGLTLISFSKACYSAYKLLTVKNETICKKYKKIFKQSALETLILAPLTTAMTLLMVFKIAPIAMAVTSVVLSAIGCVVGLFTLYQTHRNEKKIATLIKPPKIVVPTNNRIYLEESKSIKNDFHYQKNRIWELDNAPDKKHYLLSEISLKVEGLKSQIGNNPGFFDRQAPKRQAKINVLNALHRLIEHNNANAEKKGQPITDLTNLLENNDYKESFKQAFQSFFKSVGDVQDIFMAAEQYYSINREIPIIKQVKPADI